MDFGNLISRSVRMTLRHRALWLYGFLLALFSGGGGGGGGGNMNVRVPANPTTPGGAPPPLPGAPNIPGIPPGLDSNAIMRWFQSIPQSTWLIVIAVVLILFLILFVLGTIVRNVARSALIGMVDQIETTGAATMGEGWRYGWSRFAWRSFLVELIIGLIVFAVALAFAAILIMLGVGLGFTGNMNQAAGGLFGVALCLTLLIFVPLLIVMAIVVSAVQNLAWRFIVLRDYGAIASLGGGWGLFRANLGNLILLLLILFGLGLVWAAITGVVVLLVVGVLGGLPGLLVYSLTQSVWGAVAAAAPGILLTIVIGALVSTLWHVFHESIWTLAFRDLPNQAG